MTAPDNQPKTAAEGPVVTLQLGKLKFRGPSAVAAVAVVLLAIVALQLYFRPTFSNWPMWVSAALWIAFIWYWNVAARNSAPAKSAESIKSRAFHQNLMSLAFLLLFISVPGLRQRVLPAGPLIIAAGFLVQASAFLLAVWARRHLGSNWRAEIGVAVDHQLIRTGPYRLLRHPIYTALLGMFVGAALVSGKLHALLGVILLAAAYWRKIRLEEQNLLVAFGAAWDDYRRHTWAMIPGVL